MFSHVMIVPSRAIVRKSSIYSATEFWDEAVIFGQTATDKCD
jgi:hypothetical protein